MRTEREMLDLAAKAAGYWSEEFECASDLPRAGWNPRDDDGDALRLAVKLQIQITPGTYNKDEFSAFKAAGGEAHEFRHYQQDKYAATRRAIVRAAAQIGKAV